MEVVYNHIGKTYGTTRLADPQIVETVLSLLHPDPSSRYLEIACGAGNYTHAYRRRGLNVIGMDPSQTMLDQAKATDPGGEWQLGYAESLPFQQREFAGIICQNAIQHLQDRAQAFRECYRVLKEGRLVVFGTTQEQMEHYWLKHYFPTMMRKAIEHIPSTASIERDMKEAGFSKPTFHPFFVSKDTTDLFLYAAKYRPHLYFEDQIRDNISAFALYADASELANGLQLLRADLDSGRINEVIEASHCPGGDCTYIVTEK